MHERCMLDMYHMLSMDMLNMASHGAGIVYFPSGRPPRGTVYVSVPYVLGNPGFTLRNKANADVEWIVGVGTPMGECMHAYRVHAGPCVHTGCMHAIVPWGVAWPSYGSAKCPSGYWAPAQAQAQA